MPPAWHLLIAICFGMPVVSAFSCAGAYDATVLAYALIVALSVTLGFACAGLLEFVRMRLARHVIRPSRRIGIGIRTRFPPRRFFGWRHPGSLDSWSRRQFCDGLADTFALSIHLCVQGPVVRCAGRLEIACIPRQLTSFRQSLSPDRTPRPKTANQKLTKLLVTARFGQAHSSANDVKTLGKATGGIWAFASELAKSNPVIHPIPEASRIRAT